MTSELPRHSVSVTGVVQRPDGRILAIKRADDGRWVPPGGVLELAETPEQGVVREVLEETGVRIKPEVLTGVYKNMKLGVVTLAFRCHVIEGEGHPFAEFAAIEGRGSPGLTALLGVQGIATTVTRRRPATQSVDRQQKG
jgi:8-oxo-dGTP diphosphatase